MIVTLDLTPVEVAALTSKQVGPDELLETVLRRIALTPLVAQYQKQQAFDRTQRLLSLFQAAPRPLQRNIIEALGGRDDS